MITFKQHGSFKNTERYLKKLTTLEFNSIMVKFGTEGVNALRTATPKDTGETANSWSFDVFKSRGGFRIAWSNSHINEGIPVAILIQYGHGTRNGSFVQGIDFINPAMKPIFERIAENIWKEVTSL